MAKTRVKHYRKALYFCAHKWDLKTNQPKESGSTVEDVIHYVHLRMYCVLVIYTNKYTDSDRNSEDEDNGEENDNDGTAVIN